MIIKKTLYIERFFLNNIDEYNAYFNSGGTAS